jgi:hypothetical protein
MENIHDVSITQTARFTLQGKVVPAVVVRYFVGDHGPFQDQYDEDKATPEAIKDGYRKRVQQIAAAGGDLPHPPGPGY